MIYRSALLWAGILGLVAIILGAFGAHAFKSVLSTDQLISFQTGVRYQAWHAIALLALSFSPVNLPLRKWILRCWIPGSLLFSFSIYLLSTSAITGIDFSFLGPVTPIGGLFLMSGWALIFVSAIKLSRSKR